MVLVNKNFISTLRTNESTEKEEKKKINQTLTFKI